MPVSMTGDMWPKGVRTHSDMRRFAHLIAGRNAYVEDLSKLAVTDFENINDLIDEGNKAR